MSRNAQSRGRSPRRKTAAAEAPVIAARQVLAFRLSRLGLLARTRKLSTAVGDVGLPDFPPGAAASALAPRLTGAGPDTLERAYADRSLVRLRAMRGAPIVARPAEVELFAGGVLPPDEPAMRTFIGPALQSARAAGLTALESVAVVGDETEEILARGPVDRDELHAQLRKRVPRGLLPFCRGCQSHHVHPSLLYAVALDRRLLLFPQEDGPYRLVLASRWLGRARTTRKAAAPAQHESDSRQELLRRFLRAYGPATIGDYSSWAGIAASQARPTWQALETELVAVTVEDGDGRPRYLLASDRGALEAASVPADEVRLLSPGDPLLQMRDRDMLASKPLAAVIWKNLAPAGVVLAGGILAALVKAQKKRERLVLTIEPVGWPAGGRAGQERIKEAVAEQAEALARVRGCEHADISWND